MFLIDTYYSESYGSTISVFIKSKRRARNSRPDDTTADAGWSFSHAATGHHASSERS